MDGRSHAAGLVDEEDAEDEDGIRSQIVAEEENEVQSPY